MHAPRNTVRRARNLRKDMSLPEVLLWRELRERPGGFKFRRQHPIGPYVGDFVCMAARLVIEIDGEAHGMGDRPERDEVRDAALAEQGYRTMRISARDVLGNLEGVIEGIVARCGEGGPLHQPAAGPHRRVDHAPHGQGSSGGRSDPSIRTGEDLS
ncbi:endonuclease domain-containing protein [Parasphingopyxis algicola]|nr:DUF559 domain-containing protein [Parasphingopyxis algicola]QLC26825.1 endonuclease domain-containing protein [Parasphingopyxis algicola]